MSLSYFVAIIEAIIVMYGHREKYLSLLVSKMKFFNLALPEFLIHVSFKQVRYINMGPL